MEEKGFFSKIKNKFKNMFSGISKFLNSNEIDEIQNGKLNDEAFGKEDAKTLKILNKQLEDTDAFENSMYNEKRKSWKRNVKTDTVVNITNTSKEKATQKEIQLEQEQ